MESPSISLRRHPAIALMLLIIGLLTVVIGLVFNEFWIVFMGVLPVIFATLMMLSPFVVITDEVLELKNIFGMVRASYEHDGLHLLTLQQDVLFIQRGDMRAPLRRIVKKRIHPSDWRAMSEIVAQARQMRAKRK